MHHTLNLRLFDGEAPAADPMQPVITALHDYYGTTDAASLMSAMAEHRKSAGEQGERTLNALRRLQAVRDGFGTHLAAEARLRDWQSQAEALRQRHGDFDLQQAAADPSFLAMLKAGVPMDKAWLSLHLTDAPTSHRAPAAPRPAENGISRSGGLLPGTDVSRLNRQQRAELARRSLKGETIRL